jgi:hypothetical protein
MITTGIMITIEIMIIIGIMTTVEIMKIIGIMTTMEIMIIMETTVIKKEKATMVTEIGNINSYCLSITKRESHFGRALKNYLKYGKWKYLKRSENTMVSLLLVVIKTLWSHKIKSTYLHKKQLKV